MKVKDVVIRFEESHVHGSRYLLSVGVRIGGERCAYQRVVGEPFGASEFVDLEKLLTADLPLMLEGANNEFERMVQRGLDAPPPAH